MNKWNEKNDQLTADFSFNDFSEAIGFVNRVASLAEEHNHHPDILIHGYSNVRLTLTTHDRGKVTEKDFSLAGAIEKI
jgi:4a-hydroxytetrahydrobiopterin dehydratase